MDRGGRDPVVLRFSARLGQRLTIPRAVSKNLKGMTKVEGTINGHPFRAALESDPSGDCRLRVNGAMRRGADADVGDKVQLAILGPEPKPAPPPDLKAAFVASPQAKMLWKDLDDDSRRVYIRWIEAAKTPETRARRVTRTVDQLAEGKRRPCCVDVYEYMLSRIQGYGRRRP